MAQVMYGFYATRMLRKLNYSSDLYNNLEYFKYKMH